MFARKKSPTPSTTSSRKSSQGERDPDGPDDKRVSSSSQRDLGFGNEPTFAERAKTLIPQAELVVEKAKGQFGRLLQKVDEGPALPGFSADETRLQRIIVSTMFPLLLTDYFFAFDSGECMFLPDIADVAMTALGGRKTNFASYGWDLTKDFSLRGMLSRYTAVYSMMNSYFYYRICGLSARAILNFDPSFVYNMWNFRNQPERDGFWKVLMYGFLPTYFSPNDFLYRMIHDNQNLTPKMVGLFAFAVSKLDGLKRILNLYHNSRKGAPKSVTTFVFGMILTTVGILAGAFTKPHEINAMQQGRESLRDGRFVERAQKDLETFVKSPAFLSSIVCGVCLNLKFMTEDRQRQILLDVLALISVSYRYAFSDIPHYSFAHVRQFFNLDGVSKMMKSD